MSNSYDDPYAVLELPRAASADEIKRAYFALVRAHPPERDPAMFKRIRAAYERLRDAEKRVETDMLLLQPWPEPSRKRRAPRLDPQLQQADLLAAVQALSDLERRDWRDQQRPVKL